VSPIRAAARAAVAFTFLFAASASAQVDALGNGAGAPIVHSQRVAATGTARLIRSIPAPAPTGLTGLTWDGSHLWTSDALNNRAHELDPADGKELRWIP
jgi:hypothetical protein